MTGDFAARAKAFAWGLEEFTPKINAVMITDIPAPPPLWYVFKRKAEAKTTEPLRV